MPADQYDFACITSTQNVRGEFLNFIFRVLIIHFQVQRLCQRLKSLHLPIAAGAGMSGEEKIRMRQCPRPLWGEEQGNPLCPFHARRGQVE